MPSWRHVLPVHKLSSIEDQQRTMGSTLEKLRQLPFVTLARAGARLLHPSVACVLLRDGLNWRSRPHSSRCHLDATMEWICHAHDQWRPRCFARILVTARMVSAVSRNDRLHHPNHVRVRDTDRKG